LNDLVSFAAEVSDTTTLSERGGRMANLAGFDLIGEISIDTLRDFVNEQPLMIGGQWIYLLGGPFMLGLPLSVPNIGSGLVQIVCTVSFDAVTRTPNCSLTVTFVDGAATFLSRSVFHLGGTITVTAAVGFVPDTSSGALPNHIVPSVLLASAVATLTLDSSSSSQIDGTFGTGTANDLSAALTTAFESFLQGLGNQVVPAFSFQVVSGQDSSDPLVLSANPQIMWIDSSTLGIFAYYRADASGGNLAAKVDSDIVQTTQEFLYNQPGLFSVVVAKRIAVVLSPEAFHLVIACPLIHNPIVRTLLHNALIDGYINQVNANQYAYFFAEEIGAHLSQFINEDLAKNPGESHSDANNNAVKRIQALAQNDVENEAEKELTAWLDSPAGQSAIVNSTPPPCGNGSVQVDRQQMPDPFSDVITMLTNLTMNLAQGYVDVQITAGGDLPVCGSYT
jgi:hypothetical protein